MALDRVLAEIAQPASIAHGMRDIDGADDRVTEFLGGTFETRSDVDGIADQRVFMARN